MKADSLPSDPSGNLVPYNSQWKRKWKTTPIFLPGESHGQRSLAGCSPWGHGESDTTEWLTHTYTITGGPENQGWTSMSCLHSGHTSQSFTHALFLPNSWSSFLSCSLKGMCLSFKFFPKLFPSPLMTNFSYKKTQTAHRTLSFNCSFASSYYYIIFIFSLVNNRGYLL